MRGTLWHLEATPAGVTLDGDHPAGSLVLRVMDAVDLDASPVGGAATLVYQGTALTYVSADLDADTVTLASGLPVALPDGATLDVPGTMVHTAQVRLDGEDDTRPVRVEHALAATLPLGQRASAADAETVTLAETSWGGLVLTDARDRPADLGDVVDVRAEIAKHGVPVDVLTSGSLYAQTVIGVPVGDTDQVLLGTQAGGVGYYVPVQTEDGTVLVPSTRMGREYAAIDPATGETRSVLDAQGVSGPVGRFDEVYVGGQPLAEVVTHQDGSVEGRFTATKGPYTSRTGYAEVGWTAGANQEYRIEVTLDHRTNADGAYTEAWLFVSTAPVGSSPPSPDAVNGSALNGRSFVLESVNGSRAIPAFFRDTWKTGSDVEVRLGVAVRGSSVTGSTILGAHILVTHIGRKLAASGRLNLMGAGDTGGGAAPVPPPSSPPQERKATWAYAWEEVWSSAGATPARAGHAYLKAKDGSSSAASGTAYQSAWRYQTAWGVPAATRTALSAAGVSDARAWIRFYVHDGFYDRQPRIMVGLAKTSATKNSDSVLDTAPTIRDSRNLVGLTRGSWVEYELPAAWVAELASGAADAITLGDARQSTSHGQALIYNVGHPTKPPTLRAAWSEQ